MAPDERRAAALPTGRRTRDPETRARDHAQIDRLTDDVLPDLIDRLTASGLGEIEIREDDWRIRLRLPSAPGTAPWSNRTSRPADRHDRATERSDRTAERPARPSHAADGHETAARSSVVVTAADGRGNGSGPPTGGSASGATVSTAPTSPHRVIAASPAVGIFQPRPELRVGARVRQGDRLGAVDLLGLPQEVVAPEDGVVVETLAQSGEGVEYGQDLVIIEPGRGRHGPDQAPATGQPVTES